MKMILIVLVVAGGVVAAAKFGALEKIKKAVPSLPKTPTIALPQVPQVKLSKEEPKKETPDNPERDALQGKVAGIATQAQNALQGASTLFLSTPASGNDTINVGSVVNEISKQVENIPSHVLNQAKIQYCQQVLIEATKSATPTP